MGKCAAYVCGDGAVARRAGMFGFRTPVHVSFGCEGRLPVKNPGTRLRLHRLLRCVLFVRVLAMLPASQSASSPPPSANPSSAASLTSSAAASAPSQACYIARLALSCLPPSCNLLLASISVPPTLRSHVRPCSRPASIFTTAAHRFLSFLPFIARLLAPPSRPLLHSLSAVHAFHVATHRLRVLPVRAHVRAHAPFLAPFLPPSLSRTPLVSPSHAPLIPFSALCSRVHVRTRYVAPSSLRTSLSFPSPSPILASPFASASSLPPPNVMLPHRSGPSALALGLAPLTSSPPPRLFLLLSTSSALPPSSVRAYLMRMGRC